MENINSSEILKQLNASFSEAEKSKNVEFFKEVLSDDLIFRRASGIINNKKEFLEGLMKDTLVYHEISTDVRDIFISDQTKLAIVTASVYAKFTNDGKDIEGNFMNVRVFRIEGDVWKLISWYNYKV